MPAKLTTEQFIEKARAIHGDRYDYSNVEYINNKTPVTINCPDHGLFLQAPDKHLMKRGCPECGKASIAKAKRHSTSEFIDRARAAHGNQYDYSQVKYVNNRTKVTIICPDHGRFEQVPSAHLFHRQGCPACGGTGKLSTKTFIEKAKAVHGDRYDYSHVEYVNIKAPITIICPDHGDFIQVPTDHIHQKAGCPDCGRLRTGAAQRRTTRDFIRTAKSVHGDRYDYSHVEYVNNKTPVTINCPDHGNFEQVPTDHLSGKACPDCGVVHSAMARRHTTDEFIDKARALHGERYDYSQVEYLGNHTKVTIICPDHGPFEQTPTNHLFKCGCPDCAESGFNPNKRATLYYLAIATDDGDTRYKIGITNRTVEERFRPPDLARIRIVWTREYRVGLRAAKHEAEILRQYAGDRYYGPDILQTGNTELFTHDVLGLDK
jgi:tRNA(Ser,Leu) C12 N-acetylase TAN1